MEKRAEKVVVKKGGKIVDAFEIEVEENTNVDFEVFLRLKRAGWESISLLLTKNNPSGREYVLTQH